MGSDCAGATMDEEEEEDDDEEEEEEEEEEDEEDEEDAGADLNEGRCGRSSGGKRAKLPISRK
jgi:hypothetical protein